MYLPLAVAALLAGAVPFALAFTEIDAVPLRFTAAALAVLLALPCLRQASPAPARWLAGAGFVLGALFLASAGLLWLMWPK